MDFEDTPEQAEFRHTVRNWLDANATRRTDQLLTGMEGDEAFLEAKEWYLKKFQAGFACLTWPKEYGGAGLTPLHEVIWAQEVANYITRDAQFVIGIGNCGPAIMHFAEEAAKLDSLLASGDPVPDPEPDQEGRPQ